MVDFFLLLKIAGAGDELQGIKRGIMEMADAIFINKADGDNVLKSQLAKSEFGRALHLFPAKKSGWIATASTCSSITNEGIANVWKTISDFLKLTQNNNFFNENRSIQNQYWMLETINEHLKTSFYTNQSVIKLLEKNKIAVQNNKISPFIGAEQLLKLYFNKQY